ncbi:MAG: HEAT repeat domain-containing protein, partial [Deltaproteobacteria bacterium]|nr:HEAT repeat domain-containing protein [Deltaproteobacteria bacterium]
MTALLILLSCLATSDGPTRRLPPSGVLPARDALIDVARLASDTSPQAQLNLRKLLGHPAPEVRAAVLRALAAGPGIDSHVVAVYAEDESAEVRVAAMAALSPRRDPVARAAVAARLSDGVVEVRVAALAAAGRMRDPALLPLLQILAEDRDEAWRASTATALGVLGDPAAVPLLRAWALSATRGRTAQAAIAALGAIAH